MNFILIGNAPMLILKPKCDRTTSRICSWSPRCNRCQNCIWGSQRVMQATRKNDIYSCKLFCVRFEKDGLRTYLKLGFFSNEFFFYNICELDWRSWCKVSRINPFMHRDRSFSTHAKVSDKLTYVTPCWFFRKFCVYTKWMIPNRTLKILRCWHFSWSFFKVMHERLNIFFICISFVRNTQIKLVRITSRLFICHLSLCKRVFMGLFVGFVKI